ncbi:MAG: hypothetical protein LQ352_003167 [Teloschistes flavicans]|nr:MAG: hypothetical protein LQ352_003167 [Teloschistes flavicans]
MKPILQDYTTLAGGVTYSTPKIPVSSTLLATLVDGAGVFNHDYMAQQTRWPVDFVGALNAMKSKLKDPVWLEIGPAAVCSSFVRATLSPSPVKIMHSIEANAAVIESSSATTVMVSFKATSANASHNLGSITVKISDPEKTQAD